MKTRISFYINDKEETEICSIYDAPYVPFKKGDIFWYSVATLFPITIDRLKKEWKSDFVDHFCNNHKEKKESLNNTKFKIISVYNSLEYDANSTKDEDKYRYVVEFKCKKVKTIYWKFWQTYKFKKFFKLIK